MNSDKIPTRRLSRKQIAEGMQSTPIEHILLGVTTSKQKRLTSKQVAFAEQIAMGETQASAYRKAYNTKSKPIHHGHDASRLAASPAISAQVEAFRLALEAQRYATPSALRALVIERLTQAAINPDVAPAQQLRALELLGKVTEVAAFTERRELIKTDSSSNAKGRLIMSLRAAITTSSGDGGRSLLAELSRRNPDNILDIEPSNSVTHDAPADHAAADSIQINGLQVSDRSPGLDDADAHRHPPPQV